MSLRAVLGDTGVDPHSGPSTVRYGGNTPCVEVRTAGGALVILDAGTGIRELGRTSIERANGATDSRETFS